MMRRTAVTLIEVLVSIFIMGIGLLALLTLFPLGAITMAEAIKNDRCSQAAANAESIAVFRNLRGDSTFTTPFHAPPQITNPPNPATTWPDLRRVPGALEGPSYPIYVDPFGVLGLRGVRNQSVGPINMTSVSINSPGVPRRSVSYASTFPNSLRWFSLLDELEFDQNGLAKRVGTEVQREPQYTWAYLLRRPDASVISVVDVSVVVYSGRPLQLPPDEKTYGPVEFRTDSNQVTVTWDPNPPANQQKPPVRKGSWIFDATILRATGQPSPHGFFYRVTNVTEVPPINGRPAVVLELQTNPKKATTNGVLVVMEYVAEVYEKAGDWKP